MKIIVAILAVIAALAVANVVPTADGQEVLPEQSPLVTACDSVRSAAALEHLSITRCRGISEVIEGNTALVTVKVWISGKGIFIVSAAFYRSVWGQQHIRMRPV